MEMPNFMKEKPPQECIDHAMWQKHLLVAHWLLLGFGIVIGVFTEKYLAGLLLVVVALVIYFWAAHLEVKHIKWHAEQERGKGNDKV